MVVMHTPDTVNPVTAMCERYQLPCIALDAPVDAWLTRRALQVVLPRVLDRYNHG